MSKIPLSLAEEIVSQTRTILADGVPRKASEIVVLLNRLGLRVDKKIVNQVLYYQGEPEIIYDSTSHTYGLLSPTEPSFPASSITSIPAYTSIRPDIDTIRQVPNEPLTTGMYVRFPIDGEEAAYLAQCRDFRIGQVARVDGDVCVVHVTPGEHDSFQLRQVEVARALVKRCRLLENSVFSYAPKGKSGILLGTCQNGFVAGNPMTYFALLDGAVVRISETDICIEAHAQAPDPFDQLVEFEFHPSIWKNMRDQLLQNYIELQSATFGIEELVGSRILLLPHQAETIARVLSDRRCRYVLADEVGLGKTIEACVILKGLKRRIPSLKTLIIAPHTLIRQWHGELNRKFWLDFSIVNPQNRFEFDPSGPGILMSADYLQQYPQLVNSLLRRHWDLLVVDEAHRLHRRPSLYDLVHRLSQEIEHCLILSATPILRHAAEYLTLLRLMHPQQYDPMSLEMFETMLSAQGNLRRRLAYVGRALSEDDFDPDEFHDEIGPLVPELPEDRVLPLLVRSVEGKAPDRGLGAAREVHSYLSENYRIENRVIRNRRASLEGQVSLPQRVLDDTYCYHPSAEEGETLAELTQYTIEAVAHQPENAEIARLFHYAAASSPFALHNLLVLRHSWIDSKKVPDETGPGFIQLLTSTPEFPGEVHRLERLQWHLDQWMSSTRAVLDAASIGRAPAPEAPHRILQVLRAVYHICVQRKSKVLIFCRWQETYALLERLLKKHYGSHRLAVFNIGKSADDLQIEVDRFQSDDECSIMLSDESGGEGRNFQVASTIIHVDLPWMPAQIEQRIGRVDRLGRSGVVASVVPYAFRTIEHDLFKLWHQAFELFTHSMSGMEIVLEAVQDDIARMFAEDPREGLAKLLDNMTARARELRQVVEEERYAEESNAQNRRRENFARTLEDNRSGDLLKVPLLKWADLAGMPNYSQHDHVSNIEFTVFDPKRFSLNAMKNAKFVNPPNMEEALRRAGRKNALVIRGTFDREVAVQREDVVFFAPGEPWTDALVANALCADRGQCTAVMRTAPNLKEDWEGFECFYSIRIDPRPLYDSGGDPVNLFHAQGYLNAPTYRVIVGRDGQIVRRSSTVGQLLLSHPHLPGDVHLGKRSGEHSSLKLLMERFPGDAWREIVRVALSAAEQQVRSEYEFTAELADEARAVFERSIAGQRAAHRWLRGELSNREIDEYERISELLIAGIAQPQIRLESVCFWWLQAADGESHGTA